MRDLLVVAMCCLATSSLVIGCDAARTHPTITGPEETAAATQRLRERPSAEAEFTAMRSTTMEIAAVAAELIPGITFEWSKSDYLRTEQCFKPYDQTGGAMIGLESYSSAPTVAVSDEVWQQFALRVKNIAERVGATVPSSGPDPLVGGGAFYNPEDGTRIWLGRNQGISIETKVGCRLYEAQLTHAGQPTPTTLEETAAAEQRLLQRRSLEDELAEMRSAVEEIGAAVNGFLQSETFEWDSGISYEPKPCGRPYDQTQGTALALEDYEVKVISLSAIPDNGWQQFADRAREVAARFGATLPVISEIPGNYHQDFVNSEDGARISVRKNQLTVTITAQTGCRLAENPRLRRSGLPGPGEYVPYPTPFPTPTTPIARPR
ncbi:LppA family lipoprotein [Nocardia sp. NPDC058480]|uniref:LppA family lipoprotein n=1 Tax=Nocardia sp. NPDC058480 TaxID=3346522 RepID=UPI00364AF9D9